MFIKITVYSNARKIVFYDKSSTDEFWTHYYLTEIAEKLINGFSITREGWL